MSKKRCIFCEIVKGKAPSFMIKESRLSICILDINPLQKGHCLVIPKRHIRFWYEMNEEETSDLYNLAREVSLQLMKVYKADFITQYARGRRIPHTHIFLIPTFAGDPLDRYFNALEGFQEGARFLSNLGRKEELKRICREIRMGE
jgi:histidine triad (HIT) family protein